ncbi:ARM repeat superfamily protein [Striga asiatica]|uniref:ARM repeat superfamily protein n=1 Tax=Striga asiatica TaxID=4170 RepID=A0A5A7R7D7_STRAF|nr:ARM repeat superfamily protein [Striga asiatica]
MAAKLNSLLFFLLAINLLLMINAFSHANSDDVNKNPVVTTPKSRSLLLSYGLSEPVLPPNLGSLRSSYGLSEPMSPDMRSLRLSHGPMSIHSEPDSVIPPKPNQN